MAKTLERAKLKNTEQTNIEGSLTLLGGFSLVTFFFRQKSASRE